MRHILGMAKSSLDLTGAKTQKLELDLLRLIYAVQHLRNGEQDAHGYLLVLSPALVTRVCTWLAKYEATDCVTGLCHATRHDKLEALLAEKQSNAAGMISGALGEDVAGRSAAHRGQVIGETALHRLIGEKEPGVVPAPLSVRRPFAIQWDYYGTR